MKEKSTAELDRILQNTNPKEVSSYFQKNSAHMQKGEKAFYYYMKDRIEEKNFLLKDIYIAASVSESYGSKILTMEKHTKNRDLILRFCLAAHFTLEETNRALKLYGMNPLYSKNRRDVCIILAMNHRNYDIAELDRFLQEQGEAVLSGKEEP